MSKNDLEDRLLQFTVEILQLAEQLPNTKTGSKISSQIIRSSTSSSLNYAKAQSAASRKDFVRLLKVVLKELRKTNINLKMTDASALLPDSDLLVDMLKETDELIAIFVTSVRTAMQNDALAKRINKIRK
jgi:four helix bundle protein